MATVTLPVTVAADDEIVTSWGNAVVAALTELLGDARNNGVMIRGRNPQREVRCPHGCC